MHAAVDCAASGQDAAEQRGSAPTAPRPPVLRTAAPHPPGGHPAPSVPGHPEARLRCRGACRSLAVALSQRAGGQGDGGQRRRSPAPCEPWVDERTGPRRGGGWTSGANSDLKGLSAAEKAEPGQGHGGRGLGAAEEVTSRRRHQVTRRPRHGLGTDPTCGHGTHPPAPETHLGGSQSQGGQGPPAPSDGSPRRPHGDAFPRLANDHRLPGGTGPAGLASLPQTRRAPGPSVPMAVSSPSTRGAGLVDSAAPAPGPHVQEGSARPWGEGGDKGKGAELGSAGAWAARQGREGLAPSQGGAGRWPQPGDCGARLGPEGLPRGGPARASLLGPARRAALVGGAHVSSGTPLKRPHLC